MFALDEIGAARRDVRVLAFDGSRVAGPRTEALARLGRAGDGENLADAVDYLPGLRRGELGAGTMCRLIAKLFLTAG